MKLLKQGNNITLDKTPTALKEFGNPSGLAACLFPFELGHTLFLPQ
jgi:hypothetical protein